MNNIPERQRDIIRIIESLDISPTLFKNADEKYHALADYLCEHGIKADIYPQGSFAFGTVVRPSAKNGTDSYDLDFICQVDGTRNDYTADKLREIIESTLTSNSTYEDRLVVNDECFTIKYADVDGTEFSIDVVPATDESQENKSRLISESARPDLIKTAIAIPKHNKNQPYSWLTNNPKGFREWFDDINKPFLEYSREQYRKHLFEAHRSIFASVEEIPSILERSALQRVIQILKYHRNVYYDKLQNGDDLKPISAIINVIVTEISKNHTPACSTFDLLKFVLDELKIYSNHLVLNSENFEKTYGQNRKVFSHKNNEWFIENPANPEDNLADKWNENKKIPDEFFRWINALTTDFITGLSTATDAQFRVLLENSLGESVVTKVLQKKYCTIIPPKPIIPQNASKPYKNDDIIY